jgi:hypothetical protein
MTTLIVRAPAGAQSDASTTIAEKINLKNEIIFIAKRLPLIT